MHIKSNNSLESVFGNNHHPSIAKIINSKSILVCNSSVILRIKSVSISQQCEIRYLRSAIHSRWKGYNVELTSAALFGGIGSNLMDASAVVGFGEFGKFDEICRIGEYCENGGGVECGEGVEYGGGAGYGAGVEHGGGGDFCEFCDFGENGGGGEYGDFCEFCDFGENGGGVECGEGAEYSTGGVLL